MKVLILTNPEYKEFIKTYHSTKGHSIYIYDKPEKIESFDGYGLQPYDIGISFMYQHKVPAKEVNTHTWINFHPAPLPEYKGRNLCYHAIMNGEKEFGTTVHYMDENFDTGDIIDCFKFQILEGDTAETLSEFAIQQCKAQFQAYFPDIIAGKKFERIPNLGGTYYEKEPIHPYVIVDELTEKQIRAIYYPPHFPKIRIGNTDYRIVEEE